MIPKARTNDLKIRRNGDELAVYDLKQNETFCLDHLTALVRSKCNGINSPWEIQRLLRAEHGHFVNEDTIWFALTRLEELNLLEKDGDDSIRRYGSLLETRALTRDPLRARLSRALVSWFGGRREPYLVHNKFHQRES